MKYAACIRYGNSDQIATVRPRHREYLGSLKEQGKLAASGPFTDDSGALIIYEAESEAEARADPGRPLPPSRRLPGDRAEGVAPGLLARPPLVERACAPSTSIPVAPN